MQRSQAEKQSTNFTPNHAHLRQNPPHQTLQSHNKVQSCFTCVGTFLSENKKMRGTFSYLSTEGFDWWWSVKPEIRFCFPAESDSGLQRDASVETTRQPSKLKVGLHPSIRQGECPRSELPIKPRRNHRAILGCQTARRIYQNTPWSNDKLSFHGIPQKTQHHSGWGHLPFLEHQFRHSVT